MFLGSIVRRDRAAPSLLGYIVRGGRVEKDLISDDSALAYKSEQGLIVFIGCGHAGVENIIECAKEVCGDERIHAVIGGLHLKFSGPERAVALGAYLQEEAVERLFACHCTGSRKAGLPRQHQIGAGFEHSFRRKKRQSEDCREECIRCDLTWVERIAGASPRVGRHSQRPCPPYSQSGYALHPG